MFQVEILIYYHVIPKIVNLFTVQKYNLFGHIFLCTCLEGAVLASVSLLINILYVFTCFNIFWCLLLHESSGMATYCLLEIIIYASIL